jgi:NAD(P)-dependent dehydrogenase (short-subunit alcohol dehydrogenase family)
VYLNNDHQLLKLVFDCRRDLFVKCIRMYPSRFRQNNHGLQCRGFCNVSLSHAPCGYVFTKHGVVGVTKSVAAEYASRGIRMNCINPGACATEMLTEFIQSSPDPAAMQAALDNLNPVPGVIHPDAVGDAAVFLCASTNRWVAMPVDGGYLAGHVPFTTLERWEAAANEAKGNSGN